MLLQDLVTQEKYASLKKVYSVELSNESNSVDISTPLIQIEEIGFILKINETGMLDENLMDVVINYQLANVSILMEVPSQLISKGLLDVKYLLQLANNLSFSIILLPPNNKIVNNELSFEEYKNVVIKVLDQMLNTPNFDKFVYPASVFFEYLMLEQVLEKDIINSVMSENDYVKNNLSNNLSVDEKEDLKEVIRQKLYHFYGGEKEFNLIAKTMMEEVYEKMKKIYKHSVMNSFGVSEN